MLKVYARVIAMTCIVITCDDRRRGERVAEGAPFCDFLHNDRVSHVLKIFKGR